MGGLKEEDKSRLGDGFVATTWADRILILLKPDSAAELVVAEELCELEICLMVVKLFYFCLI